VPTVLRDVIYGISRNKLNTLFIALYPALKASSAGRAALMFPIVLLSCAPLPLWPAALPPPLSVTRARLRLLWRPPSPCTRLVRFARCHSPPCAPYTEPLRARVAM